LERHKTETPDYERKILRKSASRKRAGKRKGEEVRPEPTVYLDNQEKELGE